LPLPLDQSLLVGLLHGNVRGALKAQELSPVVRKLIACELRDALRWH